MRGNKQDWFPSPNLYFIKMQLGSFSVVNCKDLPDVWCRHFYPLQVRMAKQCVTRTAGFQDEYPTFFSSSRYSFFLTSRWVGPFTVEFGCQWISSGYAISSHSLHTCRFSKSQAVRCESKWMAVSVLPQWQTDTMSIMHPTTSPAHCWLKKKQNNGWKSWK